MTVLAEQIPSLARSQRAPLDRYLDTAIDIALGMDRVVGAVVIVAQSGDIVYQRAAGFADRETRKSMQLNTIFRFASLTKTDRLSCRSRLSGPGETRFGRPGHQVDTRFSSNLTRWTRAGDYRPPVADTYGRSFLRVF